jgi:protocatechuate 3,4-dioxygenase beta subunit
MKRRILTLCLCAVVLAGCDDDNEPAGPSGGDPRETRFTGTLVLVEGEFPMADLVVTLFEPAAQVAVARDVSDSEGHFEFADFPPGTYVPVVQANGYRPVLLAQPYWQVAEGDQIDIELRMRRIAEIEWTPYTLTGRVMDFETKQPIPNARIEMNFFTSSGELADVNWSEYRGWSNSLEATSDEDGFFFLSPLPLIGGREQDLWSYIPNYRVTADGYKSRVMDRNYDPESVNSIVQGVRLTPGTDEGSIEGYVRDKNGQPLEGVPVSVEWRRTDDMFRGIEPAGENLPDHILIPHGIAWSDATGYYRVTGLPEGFHVVEAGIRPDDGWVGEETRGVEISRPSLVGKADVIAYQTVVVAFPEEGTVLEGIPDRIEWEPYPGAVSYELLLRRDSDGNAVRLVSEEPRLEFDESSNFFNPVASYSCEVLAKDGNRRGIGLTDRPHVFHIRRPTD